MKAFSIFCFLCCVFVASMAQQQLSTCQDIMDIPNRDMNGSYILANHIDCSSVANFVPIGTDIKNAFTGVLDGNNFEVRNLKIEYNCVNAGLIGFAFKATIKNIVLVDFNITSTKNNVGALVGTSEGGVLIQNCHLKTSGAAASSVVKGENSVGGIVGLTDWTTLIDCSVTNTLVLGQQRIGGIVGQAAGGTVLDKCFNFGFPSNSSQEIVIGTLGGVGGLIGEGISVTLRMCGVENGHVVGVTRVGGLIGNDRNAFSFEQVYVLETVNVTASTNSSYGGGLIGYSQGFPDFTDVYSRATVTVGNKASAGGLIGHLTLSGDVKMTNVYSPAVIFGGLREKTAGLVGSLFSCLETNELNFCNSYFENSVFKVAVNTFAAKTLGNATGTDIHAIEAKFSSLNPAIWEASRLRIQPRSK